MLDVRSFAKGTAEEIGDVGFAVVAACYSGYMHAAAFGIHVDYNNSEQLHVKRILLYLLATLGSRKTLLQPDPATLYVKLHGGTSA